MKIENLKSKLAKMNIPFTILQGNGYNKDIEFSINGITFKAGFTEGKTEIDDFCRELCFDKSEQEMQRRFFDNFNQLVRYANA